MLCNVCCGFGSISDLLPFLLFFFFFFKQKTAYEMLRSLVGSEMCIRDSSGLGILGATFDRADPTWSANRSNCSKYDFLTNPCLLYTSDAADEEDSVDLGGRRLIKKKTTYTNT